MADEWPAELDEDARHRLSLAERVMCHTFRDRSLLHSALTHPSAIEDVDPARYYERLEFLGDSVVGLVIAEEAYRRYPELDEGGLTRVKVSIVSGSTLSAVALELGLVEAVEFGKSVRGTGERAIRSASENVYEAVTGALYLDAGLETARRWILSTLGPLISADAAAEPENPKSRLQELTQTRKLTPVYRIERQSGPPHDREFVAVVEVSGKVVGRGVGRSKKDAEAQAAADAMERFGGR